MSRVGQYDHLQVSAKLNLDRIAQHCVEQNYGVHQMLSALVRAHKTEKIGDAYEWWIMPKIAKLLEEGNF